MNLVDYTQAYRGYLWQLEESGQVFAIPDGSTIAYSQQVLEMLEQFGDQPIPRLTSLLLILIATNPTADQDLNKIEEILKNLKPVGFTNQMVDKGTREDVLGLLRNVANLKPGIKQGPHRQQLIQLLFADSHKRVGSKKARRILTEWRYFGAVPGEIELPSVSNANHGPIQNDLRGLAMLHEQYPSTRAIEKALMNLAEVDTLLLEPEPTESGSEGNLMEALQAEPQTFKLGALVPHVWAGMNIPYHLALPGGQPLGGVSDISNRGDLERLLISEYANDSEVFLSRLANGEALYLRREEPPASEEFQRIILVDISMKNWGTPKLIALSILVAIAHHPKSDITCTAFAVGNQLMPLDFTTVEGLMDAQQLLEGTLHAEVGLERFMQEHIPSKQTEVFFISTQAATEYPAMYRVLNEYHHQFTYWINVEHDGRVRLFKNRFNSKHLLQEFTLPLDRLWRNPPKEAKKHPSEIALTGSPGVHPYPLLFPVPNNALAIYRPNPKGPSYLSTRQKGVFKSGQGMGLGMELLAEASYIHKGCKFAILEQNEGLVWLTFVPQTRRGYLVNLSSGEETSFSLPNWRDSIKHAEFFSTEGAFYYLGFRYTYRIEPHDSPRVTKTEGVSPEMREAYENRLRTRFPSTAGSFSKVTNISISTTQTLVINGMPRLHTAVQSPGIQGGHVKQGKLLRLSTQGGMEWVSITRNHLRYVQGENRMDENHFKFGDGSIVEVDKRGILTCRSSDNDLPVFYLTMVMQNANAGATELVFTGPKDYKAPHTVQEPMDTRHFFETYVQAFCKRIIRWYEANA